MVSMPKYAKRRGEGTSEQQKGASHRGLTWAAVVGKGVREDVIGGREPCGHLGKKEALCIAHAKVLR